MPRRLAALLAVALLAGACGGTLLLSSAGADTPEPSGTDLYQDDAGQPFVNSVSIDDQVQTNVTFSIANGSVEGTLTDSYGAAVVSTPITVSSSCNNVTAASNAVTGIDGSFAAALPIIPDCVTETVSVASTGDTEFAAANATTTEQTGWLHPGNVHVARRRRGRTLTYTLTKMVGIRSVSAMATRKHHRVRFRVTHDRRRHKVVLRARLKRGRWTVTIAYKMRAGYAPLKPRRTHLLLR